MYEDDDEMAYVEDTGTSVPSVIDLLMQAEPSASKIKDPQGKSALDYAMATGKKRNQGVKALTEVEGLEISVQKSLNISTN